MSGDHPYRAMALALTHELIDKAQAEFPYGALAINLIAVALEKGSRVHKPTGQTMTMQKTPSLAGMTSWTAGLRLPEDGNVMALPGRYIVKILFDDEAQLKAWVAWIMAHEAEPPGWQCPACGRWVVPGDGSECIPEGSAPPGADTPHSKPIP